ncbi:MAG: argininosuccinate synthase [Methanoregula sp.]|jgi:hypothetical protein|nr:argininosuccinate synthase [Methanoregula sp.]
MIVILTGAVSAATTEVHIARYAADNVTVINETTVTYQWMEANLPVMGDGVTHYYHQGPVFVDDADPARQEELRWNPKEDTNVDVKGMGALKGTNVKDLCDLVGGMSPGDEVKIKSVDGWNRRFAYKNVYQYTSRDGPMVLTWYNAAETPGTWERQGVGYVPGYYSGLRLVWFTDTSTNPGGLHAFGNYDWHEAADSKYWYYYSSGPEKYPTTTGLSGKYVSDILIYSGSTVQGEPTRAATTTTAAAPTRAGISPFATICALAACGFLGYSMQKRG